MGASIAPVRSSGEQATWWPAEGGRLERVRGNKLSVVALLVTAVFVALLDVYRRESVRLTTILVAVGGRVPT
jgi:hypothetical protein